ncbi:conserved hypothetical protein [Nautilia profundicola AmH]|uniref:DUF58 domain-containing protein n=1 Tax=Nautilia profundicola (strain ATCC BAA-1463 / DSM 18972 / AmH) TaxID=598659 RepID=B9L898_NAUPA|nr:DUF58 domain-containing protein [Nautilia profundicola]ACM92877.1 conserved hypothetical protein [Nautilia profundicola AmH]
MKTNAIIIKTKKRIFGNLLGRNLSKFKGSGLDFKEFREYVYGEDSKKIDWKVSAKINKPLVKEYDEERELRIIIAVLKSGTLYFGSRKLKTELIAEIIATLGIAALEEDNKIECLFLGKNKKIFKPTKNKKSVYSFVEYTLKTEYLEEDYTQKDIDFLNSFKKSLLFIIGDFLKPVEINTLKHETYIINVRDRFEEDPKFKGYTEIVDPVNLNSINVNFTNSTVKKLKKHINKIDKALITQCKKHKIPYTKIYTDEEPIHKLIKLVR